MSLIKYKCDNCGFLNPRLIKTKCDTCHNKYYKFNNDFNTLCNDCSLNLNPRGNTTFTLKDNEFNSTEILLLDHISNNFYNINGLYRELDTYVESNEELKTKCKKLEERNSELEDKVSSLEEKIEALRVAHESLLDTFRGYNK